LGIKFGLQNLRFPKNVYEWPHIALADTHHYSQQTIPNVLTHVLPEKPCSLSFVQTESHSQCMATIIYDMCPAHRMTISSALTKKEFDQSYFCKPLGKY